MKSALDKKEVFLCVVIFILALFVRLFHLYDVSANPTFKALFVDSAIFDKLARSIVAGDTVGEEFFWHSSFYTIFLSVIYFFSGSSIIVAKVFQSILGSITCLLTYYVGKEIFDRRTGAFAAVIMVFYGPLIFFEGELLATGLATFWSILLIWLLMKVCVEKKPWLCFILGVCGAASILTRPTFLPFFAATCVWLAFAFFNSEERWRGLSIRLCGVLIGFLLVAAPIAVLNYRITGHFGILPASGGINIYIGNNPKTSETMTIRPNNFERLVEIPIQEGITGIYNEQEYWHKKVLDYVLSDPVDFLGGLLHKTVQFVSSREIPRIWDIYVFHKWSRPLRLLAWKAGPFGFPFGVLLPLAVLGLVFNYRKIPIPFFIFLLLYPLSIILVYVAGRFRLPIVPLLSVLGASGCLGIAEIVRIRRLCQLVVVIICVLGIILLSTLPGPFCVEKIDTYEPELYERKAYVLEQQGIFDEAVALHMTALHFKPDFAPAHTALGRVLLKQDKKTEALTHYAEAIRLTPNDPDIYIDMANTMSKLGNKDEAIRYYKKALEIRNDLPEVHYNLGNALLSQNMLDAAITHYNKALQLRNSWPSAHTNLGIALSRQGRMDEAIKHFLAVVYLTPSNAKSHYHLGLVLASQGKHEEAITHFAEAVRLQPNDYDAHYNLATALADYGRIEEAIKEFREALKLKPEDLGTLDYLAQILAIHDNPSIRNPSEAIRLAEKACKITDYKHPHLLDTLAQAYAAAGRFAEAADTAEKALELSLSSGNKELIEHLQKKLKYYKNRIEEQKPSTIEVKP